MRRAGLATGLLLTVLGVALLTGSWLAEREDDASAAVVAVPADQVTRGAYLARAGNCAGCHTARGGPVYGGGRELSTPFGTFVTPNITPHRDGGIGQWSAQEFWRAMHHGRGRDGRPLYPAFPYTEYTRVTREDSDAIFAYLQTIAPVSQQVASNRLNFPYNLRPLLFAWRALYFRPGVYQPSNTQGAEWNRGAYLVQGLGHCNACHATRNALGAAGGAALGGGQVAGRSWYAPSLTSMAEAGSGGRSIDETARLLATGIAGNSAAAGPMAEVVAQSLQHLSVADVRAMAVYLQSISVAATSQPDPSELTAESKLRVEKGAAIYDKHCKDCHGASGEGAPGIYPALAGNRGVTMASPLNTIRSVLDGGFTPVTAGNPRPYGMPPFGHALSNEEVAQVVSYIRNAWGNRASVVSAVQVDKSGSD